MSKLADLVTTIAEELGCTALCWAPASMPAQDLPRPLRDFYAEADGLELPFLSLYPQSSLRAEFLPGWICFGQDRYFSFCLCSTSGGDLPITLWDHESRTPPERLYADVSELIAAMYAEDYEESDVPCTVRISVVPADASRAAVVTVLKRISTLTSAQMLGNLKAAPFDLPAATRKCAIDVMRALRVHGVVCALLDRPDEST